MTVYLPRLRPLVRPLSGSSLDFDDLLVHARSARYVLIGEATHGTHEFYRIRAELTKRLLMKWGFSAVAIEGDWPDAYDVHRYVRGSRDFADADEALGGFRRFPSWMWRNADVLDFVGWLRAFNDELPERLKASFFGLDLYSMYRSMDAVIEYLDTVDRDAAQKARERYACFDRFGKDVEDYARRVGLGLSASCRNEALAQLNEMLQRRFAAAAADRKLSEDERLFAGEQNARVVASAEAYYRKMLDADISSWNQRDRFMYDTLERISEHIERTSGEPAKIVVWAHNSHVGDARATSMGAGREFNIGQLAREANPSSTYLIGFATGEGTVTAASQWHGEPERKVVRSPLDGSWESLFQKLGVEKFSLDLRRARAAYPELDISLLQRAIGVLYLPQSELRSHYMQARLCRQFDAILYYERTRAVEPLERSPLWQIGEAPETYPTGV
jgi:erythromycin esterase-like protein